MSQDEPNADPNDPRTFWEVLHTVSPFTRIRLGTSGTTLTRVVKEVWDAIPPDWRAYYAKPDPLMITNLQHVFDEQLEIRGERANKVRDFMSTLNHGKDSVVLNPTVDNEQKSEQLLS